MTKHNFYKVLKRAVNNDWTDFPSYYSTQVCMAIESKILTEKQLLSIILAECFSLNGDLMNDEIEACFNRLKKMTLI